MRNIHLLYVITKLELGGAQKQLLSLITHLDRKRYNLSLITAQEGILVQYAQSIKDLRLIKLRNLERPINPIKDFLALCQIYNFIKRHKVDIVHTHSSKAGILGRWAARLAGVEIIIHTVHGWSFNDYQNLLWHKITIWLERLIALITDKLIVVSNHDLQKGLNNHIGNRDKYRLIRYGIDYREFNPLDKDSQDEGLRRELGIAASDLLVGMVSCFKPQKSPQSFIKLAFLVNKSLPQIHPHTNCVNNSTNKTIGVGVKFLLVGDGILRKNIEGLISKFNLKQQVILAGWRQDIPRILSAIDIFVLTSLWEGLPISILEAMAASLPIVVTNTGGVTEIIREGENGFLVAPGNINKMNEKLNHLLKDRDLRNQIGRNAKNCLDSNFNLENMIRNTENLYQNLINKHREAYVN